MRKILPISLICLALFFAGAQVIFGATKPAGLNLPDISIEQLLTNIFNLAAKIVASIAALAIVIGGIMWMTAGGNAETETKARQTIIAAVIGLIIVGAAVGIVNFVLRIF
jgi:uncharacterized membrane protein